MTAFDVTREDAIAAMRRLHDMTVNTVTTADRQQALDEMLAAAIDLLGADFGNIQLLDADRKVLRIVAHKGFDAAFLSTFATVDADDDTACGRALRTREPCWIEDITIDDLYGPYRAIAAETGYRAVQSTPLVCRERDLLGVLSTHFRTPRARTEWDRHIVDLIAQQAADLIASLRQKEQLASLNAALQERNAELTRHERSSDAFLTALGHELRNPLGAINHSLELLTAPDERSARAIAVLQRKSEQLGRLIDDLLDLERIKHDKFELRREVIDVVHKIRESAAAVSERARAKGLRIDLDLPSGPLYCDADPTRFTQVMDNLLDNALRFTEHGSITISAARNGGRVRIGVRDTGVGIAAADLGAVFAPYYQTRQGRRAGGLGFGLALVNRIVGLHGGTVAVESGGDGAGSEFVVLLPESNEASRTEPARAAAALPVRRVLVVDDEHDNADMFAAVLEMLGQNVKIAYSGSDAIAAVEREEFDVAFLDLSMPEMDGTEVARHLRDNGNGLVLVALSGFAAPVSGDGPFERRLLKPAGIDDVAELLRSLPARA